MARVIVYKGRNRKNFPGRFSQNWALVEPAEFEKMKKAGAIRPAAPPTPPPADEPAPTDERTDD